MQIIDQSCTLYDDVTNGAIYGVVLPVLIKMYFTYREYEFLINVDYLSGTEPGIKKCQSNIKLVTIEVLEFSKFEISERKVQKNCTLKFLSVLRL